MTAIEPIEVELSDDWFHYSKPMLGFHMLGTVRRDGITIGALAHSILSGAYAVVNGAEIEMLGKEATLTAIALARRRSDRRSH
jgi:hypothetical protein